MLSKEHLIRMIISFTLLVATILCIVYGVIAWRAHSGTAFWMVWECMALCFLALWFALQFHLLAKIPPIARGIMLALICIGILVLLFLTTCVIRHFHDEGEPNLNYVIVLGAQLRQTGPSIILQERLDTAVTYLKENPETICIVSGGQGTNEPKSEAEGMRDYLVAKGIDTTRILLEDQSTNTIENIRFSKQILDSDCNRQYKNVGIITNNFHIFRATSIAKKQGLQGVYGIAAPSHPAYLPNNVFRECIGILKDRLVGNM